MRLNTKPKFIVNELSENQEKYMALSFKESEELKERDLKCPYCLFIIEGIFSDAIGHIRVKCPKCKAGMILNLAYFRKKKDNLYCLLK